jgi:hypothetical protein
MRGRLRIGILLALAALAPVGLARADEVEGVDAGLRPVELADAGLALPAIPTDEPPTDEETAPEPDHAALPEGHEPEITVRVTPEEGVATGDVVHLELTIEVPEGDDVNLPRQSYAPFELVGQDHAESVVDGRRRFVFTLDLLALEPGDLELPGTTVRVITADGVVGTVHTDARMVRVESLIANEPDAQPRPATEPVVVMQDDYTLAYVAGALALMALTALITWLVARWWRTRPRELPPPPPPRPPAEVALEKLRGLRGQLTSALAEGNQARVVDGASDALREYLGHRFDFNGLESTTDEVIGRLRHQRMAGVSLAEVTTLLGDCDLVKFAKAVPDAQDCEKVIADAENIVRRTMHANVTAIAPPSPPTLRDPSESASRSRAAARENVAPESVASESGASENGAPARSAEPLASGEPVVSAEPVARPREVPPIEASDPGLAIPVTNPPPPPDARTLSDGSPSSAASLPSFAIPETPVPPPPPRDSEEPAAPAEPITEEELWARLDDAVAEDRLVAGEVVARREDGFLVRLEGGVNAVLPEAQLGGLDADSLVGQERAFRIVSLHTGRKRIVLSHRDVDGVAEGALVGRKTPIGHADPSGRAGGAP